ncbi:MAG TPA: DinB family protein [Phycisphaerales bacterium]|nr:DinB family protein [Phycisphaerales bacterium]
MTQTTARAIDFSRCRAAPPTLEEFIALDHAALVERYCLGVENFSRRLFDLDDRQLDTAFLPGTTPDVGRWPARVLLGHLADAELVFSHRMRRTVAEDRPVLAVFDENALIDAGLYNGPTHPAAGFVAVIHTLRRWTGEWLGTLKEPQWARACLHPERGELSVRRIADYATWHLEHHGWYLQRKIEKLLGPEPAGRCSGCQCSK